MPNNITKFTIYGERCSGTNYLENIFLMNFDIELKWEYGHKHFFGFSDLSGSDNTLFLSIVRNPFDWYNSFFVHPHHIKKELTDSVPNFLYKELHSYKVDNDNNYIEIENDRNMYTGLPWNNIVELRNIKLKYMIETLPTAVRHNVLVRYEDLLDNFDTVLCDIKEKYNLAIRPTANFPQNSTTYFGPKNHLGTYKKSTYSTITKEMIKSHKDYTDFYESQLRYVL